METFDLLIQGFGNALRFSNLFSCFVGCFVGTIIGILPGVGPSTTVALMIPIAFTIRPETALIMMLGVYLGAMYGGTLTSVLLKVPGEASSVMTAIDGFEMAKQGKAGPALAVSAIGSFIGGTLSVVALTFLAPIVASYALAIGPAEFFSLMVAALIFASVLIGEDLIKGLVAVMLGLLIAVVGIDLQTGVPRLTFGLSALLEGISIIVIIMGVFGVGEVFWFLAHKEESGGERLAISGRLWPDKEDWHRSWPAILRGSAVGFFAGLLPGSGSSLGSIMAYTAEQRVSKEPERFGKGAVEAVASAETANNSATGGALIPMITLGIPGSGTTAVLLVVLMMYGLEPGPRLMIEQPQLMWTVVASLYVSNVVLLCYNLPMIPLFLRILDIPVRYLMPMILAIAAVGAYAFNNNFADLVLLFVFGALGYFMRATNVPPVPMVLGVILGPRMEQSLRQALLLSNGDWMVFLRHPISAIFLMSGLVIVVWDIYSRLRKRKKTAANANASQEINKE